MNILFRLVSFVKSSSPILQKSTWEYWPKSGTIALGVVTRKQDQRKSAFSPLPPKLRPSPPFSSSPSTFPFFQLVGEDGDSKPKVLLAFHSVLENTRTKRECEAGIGPLSLFLPSDFRKEDEERGSRERKYSWYRKTRRRTRTVFGGRNYFFPFPRTARTNEAFN